MFHTAFGLWNAFKVQLIPGFEAIATAAPAWTPVQLRPAAA
jgi:hypothetical protein